MKKKFALLMAAVVALSAVLSGCGGGTSSSAAASGSGSAAAAVSGSATAADDGTLTIGAASDIVTLDPHDQNQTNCQDLFASIGSTMFTRDLEFNLVNDLCTEYTQDSDTEWTFHIREGVKFNNGEDLTADDVKYSYDRVSQDSALVGYTYLKAIVSTEVVDDYTVKVTTNGARPDLPTLLAMASSTIMPKDFMEENGIDGYIESPVTSGAYNLVEWVPDDHYTIEPNPDYYGEPATWDQVTYRVIPESSTRVSELLAGGVDVIYNVPVNEWERVGAEGSGTSLVYGETSRVMLLVVRCTDGYATSDPLVREALELAIDKDAICDTLLQGAGVPTRTRVASSVPGFDESLYGSENANLYDPERAMELLAEAGYGEGGQPLEITLTSPNGRYLMDAEMAQMIAAYFEAVGVTVNLELVDGTVLNNMFTGKENKDLLLIGLSDGQYDGLYALGNNADPARAEGQTDYFNDELTDLYNSARVEMDETARTEMEQQMQQILAEDRPFIQIAQMNAVFGVSDRVTLTPRMDTNIMPDEVTLAQ